MVDMMVVKSADLKVAYWVESSAGHSEMRLAAWTVTQLAEKMVDPTAAMSAEETVEMKAAQMVESSVE